MDYVRGGKRQLKREQRQSRGRVALAKTLRAVSNLNADLGRRA